LNNESVVYTEANSFHLIDASSENSLLLSLNHDSKITFNSIKFNLGIDSITNVSGAMGGDLDPTKGMYWTWRNGYINTKIEGRCSASPLPKQAFQFHLGGYESPFNSMQRIYFPLCKKNSIRANIQWEDFFLQISWGKQNQIMSPSTDAVNFSNALSKTIQIEP